MLGAKGQRAEENERIPFRALEVRMKNPATVMGLPRGELFA